MPATARAAAKAPPTGMTTLPAAPEEEEEEPEAVLDFVELPEELVDPDEVVVAVPEEVLVAMVVEPVLVLPVWLANAAD